ncbi:mCG148171 [Mus musculus]|nr:mCG148171 [Mus musculus]
MGWSCRKALGPGRHRRGTGCFCVAGAARVRPLTQNCIKLSFYFPTQEMNHIPQRLDGSTHKLLPPEERFQ